MTIDWNHFTPISALAGGLLIGLAASLLILLQGRIAGISGIVGGIFRRGQQRDIGWRAAFVLGLVLAPVLFALFAPLPASHIDSDADSLLLAGLLVGIGTRIGSGCTSGHGVCGLSRRSLRSLVATSGFMAAGFITVFFLRHILA